MTEMPRPADPRPGRDPRRAGGPLSPPWSAAWLLAALLGAGAPAWPAAAEPERGRHDATAHHPFTDPDRWSKVFDDPGRDAWQKPDQVAAALQIEPGMIVADIGAGTGYFLEHLSREAGPGGIVLAIDTEAEMVAYLGKRMADAGVANVVPVLALPGDPFLPRARVDRVLIVDTYHHIDGRIGYFRRMRDAMAPGGRLAIIDYLKKPLPVGPPPEHKLERAFVIEEMTEAGWRMADEKPDLLPYQYFLVFEALPR
jgi:ubiquinone/menaquinone biosynthesis C-methylase UbiE